MAARRECPDTGTLPYNPSEEKVMPEANINGVKLYYELRGSGEPLALVHGAWADATAWRFVVPGLAESFRVLSYDRRGHSRSERPATQGSVDEDGDDLAALLEALDLAPAHVVTNSGGSNIALRLATRRPELFRSLSCHEPALWGLLEEDPASHEVLQQAARILETVGKRIAQGITRARRNSSSMRSPSVPARGTTNYRPSRKRSSSRTLPPSSTSSMARTR
jgi:pimeloyl-ACP methyl ester carboxylesterase